MSDYGEMAEHLNKKRSLKFELLGVPESLNILLRLHWGKRKAQNDYWYEYVYFTTRKFQIKKPFEKARLSITRFSSRTLDFDGVVGSLKPICDGLIHAGIIRSDDWSTLGPWCVDQVKQKQQKLVIEVKES